MIRMCAHPFSTSIYTSKSFTLHWQCLSNNKFLRRHFSFSAWLYLHEDFSVAECVNYRFRNASIATTTYGWAIDDDEDKTTQMLNAIPSSDTHWCRLGSVLGHSERKIDRNPPRVLLRSRSGVFEKKRSFDGWDCL